VENPPRSSPREPLTVLLVGTAVLAVLQTRAKIERNGEGGWMFRFSKKPANQPALQALIATLCGYLMGK
jgi:hypothetical protein